ncbi:Peptide methionine sulfoxide reductase A4, chloroplastic [Orobanche gracilis]
MLLKSTAITIAAPSISSFKHPFLIPKPSLLKTFNSSRNLTVKPSTPRMSWLSKLRFGVRSPSDSPVGSPSSSIITQGPDDDIPAPGQQFAQFGAGCFWGVELAYQRVPGVTNTVVGYSQGYMHNPTYEDVCSGTTNHSEVVRVQYDPKECSFATLLDVFWARHDPTTLNRQMIIDKMMKNRLRWFDQYEMGNDIGSQYRSGIYFYTPEQEREAIESKEKQQKILHRQIVTEILPSKKFYRAEEYHQQYLAKGGRLGSGQSAEKGCNDPIRCYG